MATKTINTRIGLKYDLYSNWTRKGDWSNGVFTPSESGASTFDAGFTPIPGEVIFYVIPSPAPNGAPVTNPPAILFKVGDGTNFLKDLPWGSAIAADVYSWAKQQSLLGGTESEGTWTWSQDAAYSQEQAEVSAFVKRETANIKIRIVPSNPPTGHEGEDDWYDTEVSTDNGTTWIPSNTPFQINIEAYTAGDGLSLDGTEFSVNLGDNNDYLEFGQNGELQATAVTAVYTPAVPATEGVHWTQEEIESAQDGDPAYGKTTDDWKVEPTEAVPASITAGDGLLTGDSVEAIKNYVDAVSSQQSTAGAVTVTETTGSGDILKVYTIAQGGQTVGTINIPKDFLVKSANLIEVVEYEGNYYNSTDTGHENPLTGVSAEGKYIDFVVNVKTGTDTDSHIYLAVNDLVDVYSGNWTSGTDAAGNTGFVKIEVDSNNVVSAHTYTGTLDSVHNETYAFTSWSAADGGTQYGTGTAEKVSSDSNSTTVKVTQNSVAGWTGRVFTVNATEVTTGQRYQLYENGSEIPVWVEIGTVTPATSDALATVNDVKSYVDTHISQATPNIEAGDGIEIETAGSTKTVSVKLDETGQDGNGNEGSGLAVSADGLKIDDSLTWYLQCGGAE